MELISWFAMSAGTDGGSNVGLTGPAVGEGDYSVSLSSNKPAD